MFVLLLCLSFITHDVADPAAEVATIFTQVHPRNSSWGSFEKSLQQKRAVVLVHGLFPHPISATKPFTARLHSWQQPESTLVSTLGKSSDVYAFAYSQNVPVETVSASFGLRFGVETLRSMGYEEIILLGHSAGGLICRSLVEDYPQEPVSKVIQLASPNGGSILAWATILVRRPQEDFLRSLSKQQRLERAGKQIPAQVQFVCVVCNGALIGDGWVANKNQWTHDLQAQGIPAYIWWTSHHGVIRTKKNAEKLRALLEQELPRWNGTQVSLARKKLWWMGNEPTTSKR